MMNIMISPCFLQGISFRNMINHLSSSFMVSSMSHGVFGIGNKSFDSSCRSPVSKFKMPVHEAASLCTRFYSSPKLQKTPLLLCSRALSIQVFRSDNIGSRSFRCYQHASNVWNLCNLQNKQSCSYTSINAASSLPDESSVSRMSRTKILAVQNVLFDYLHFTRSLQSTHAEHISKNSPMFVQSLLAKVKDGEDVTRSLTRYICFNPINEYEPFFESLGLSPSEIYPILRQDMIFLSDDGLLLENYHVLYTYGVPRSKIGKMYKEGIEIFRYDYGVLNSKLLSYEVLGLSKPTIIKLITCCPTLLIGNLNVDFLEVLHKLKVIGVELDLIRGCLSDKCTYHWDRILKMLFFIDGMCYNQKEVALLINNHPRFVFDDSGKKIYILVALLLKLGLKMGDILHLFVQNPQILAGNFVKNLWQSIDFLVDIDMDVEDIKMIVKGYPHVLGASSCKNPDFVMQTLNVSKIRLRDIIKEDPNQFAYLATQKKSNSASLPKVEGTFLREKTEFLLKLGFVENSDEMARALKNFRGRGDQLQERFDFIVDIGLDYHTTAEMIRAVPPVLNQSVDVLSKKITYLLNDLGYPLEALAAFPAYLCYNLDKVKLRVSMFQWLQENGIGFCIRSRNKASSTTALSTLLACSEERFFKYFINMHPNGPEEWERLKRSLS